MFNVASRANQSRLLILCYHGQSLLDEHKFWPGMFHTPEVFRQRTESLRRYGYNEVTLEEGVTRLQSGTLRSRDFVITFDDGFYSTYAIAAPLLEASGYRATIYVTTYYMNHTNPVFRLAIQYMFWKSRALEVDLSTWLPQRRHAIALGSPEAGVAMQELFKYGETEVDEPGRVVIARDVGRRLGVDYEELERSRRLSLMTEAEVADLARRGFDIQLHTHRHRCAPDNVRTEVIDNRKALAPLTGGRLHHLCYPSGVWSSEVWASLEAEGVRTATTCDIGLNSASTPLLALRRILDIGTMPQIVFEAEMCGLMQLLRNAAGRDGIQPQSEHV